MDYRASARFVRVAPSKARQVIAHIRGASVPQARHLLALSPKGVAPQILKTLNSAVANATYAEDGLTDDDLVVASAFVDQGRSARRMRARAMGRGAYYRRPTSHITIVVERDVRRVGALAGSRRRGRRPSRQDRKG